MRRLVLFLAAAVLAAAIPAPAAEAALPTVGPGDWMTGSVGDCTLSFAFDGLGAKAGKVYLLTAAHCASSVGETIGVSGMPQFGTIAYLGNAGATATDFALIEVKTAYVPQVRASVQGYPQYPTGYTRASETGLGDVLQASGYGVGFQYHALTRESRVGVLTYDDAQVFEFVGAMTFGDSGGPLVHAETGKAIGIESRVCLGACTDEGPTIEGILAKAAAAGFPLALRTV